jgi:DNA-directed RNA polymerase subunit alpha
MQKEQRWKNSFGCGFFTDRESSLLVERARKGQETDLDAVILGVKTDGSISPKEALLESSKILQEFSGKVMVALGVSKKEVEERAEEVNKIKIEEEAVSEETDEIGSWKVEDLPISKRSKTGLLAGGYNTLKDLRGILQHSYFLYRIWQ